MIKRIISLVAVMALLVTIFASAGSAAQKPVILHMVYWHPEQKVIMEKINSMFMKRNKDITIELEQIPGDQYDKVMKTRMLSDNGPDVYLYFGVMAYKFAQDGYLGDLTNESFAKNVVPAYKGSCSYQGKLYAIPLNALGTGVYYNKKVFQDVGITQLPKNYSDFLNICEKIKKAGKVPLARGAKDMWTSLHETGPLASHIFISDPNFQVDRYKGKFKFATNPDFRKYIERYIELSNKGYFDKGILGMNHTQAMQGIGMEIPQW